MEPIYSERSFQRDDYGTLVAEASELGLRPGVPMPRVLRVAFRDETIGSFAFTRADTNGEDIAGWNYVRLWGAESGAGFQRLLIIND